MNPWRGLGGLPRDIWILAAVTLINRSGTMVLPFLALYLTRKLAFSPEQAAIVVAFFGVSAMIASPLAGRLSDLIGPVQIMRLSLLLAGVVLMIFPLAQDFSSVMAMTFIFAITNEAFRPASLAVITDLVEPERRKSAFVLNRLAINLGMSIGPAIGGFLAMVSFKWIFYVDGVTSICAGLLMSLATWNYRGHKTSTGQAGDSPAIVNHQGSVLADQRFLYFLLAMMLIAMVFFQHEAAMPLFLVRDLHLTEADYGMLCAINTILIISLEVPLNTAMADWTYRHLLALGAALFGLGFGALAFVNGFYSAALTIVIWTFGEMILLPSCSNYVAEIAPADRRGQYMGLYTMAFGLAFAIGPGLGVMVMERYSAPALWIGTLAFSAVAVLMMYRIREQSPVR